MLPNRLSSALVHTSSPLPRPRIAYLITNSEIGGAQAHVADLLRALRGQVDATVLAGGDGPLFAAARAAGANTVRLSLLDNTMSPLRAVSTLRQIVAALRQAAPDVIHVHSAKAGALGRLAGWWLGIPVVYTVHGFAFKPAAPAVRRIASRLAEWCLAPLTSHLICVADAERAMAASLPIASTRVSVIHNGIADTPERAAPGEPLRRIVMVARFAAPKRPEVLIRAFARAGIDDCELVIAGDGPLRDDMRALAHQLAPGRIHLPGNIDDIPGLLASAQLFVLVSDHEGLPLSILEAMRAGLPVVATDLPGIREQFGAESAGVLLSGNDDVSLARILGALATGPERRIVLGQAARGRWARAFELGPMADATWRVYQQAIGQAASAAPVRTGDA